MTEAEQNVREEEPGVNDERLGVRDARRLEAVVRGRVQGVGFRMHVRSAARRLGLAGWVANEPGGRVRCVAEGPDDALDELETVIRRGPPGARVERVDVSRWPATGEFDGFDIRSGWHPGG